MRLYKVKHINSGLFWKGGDIPSQNLTTEKLLEEKFTNYGKVWNQVHHIEAALRNVTQGTLQRVLIDECEIVEYIADPVFSVLPLQIDKLKERVKHGRK